MGVTHHGWNAKQFLPMLIQVDAIYRDFPSARIDAKLRPKSTRDDLMPKANTDDWFVRCMENLSDVVDKGQYPRLVVKGTVLYDTE